MKKKQLLSAILITGFVLTSFSASQVCGQSTMKSDQKKSMGDTTKMKKDAMHDSKKDMKHDDMKMKKDSTKMMKDKM